MAKKAAKARSKGVSRKGGIVFTIAGLIFLAITVVNIKYIFSGEENIFLLGNIKKEITRTQSKVDDLTEENKAKKEYIDNLRNDPQIIEEEARRSLNLVKDDETLFVFPDEEK